jgi:DNA-binding CsgD family transcriptional regulator
MPPVASAIPKNQGLPQGWRRCENPAMLPGARDYVRATRRIERAVGSPQDAADATIHGLIEGATDVLGITGSCWHHTDPASGMPIENSALGDPPGSLEWSLEYEFRRPDLNRFEDLRTRRPPVAAISTETRGDLAASARFREMIHPAGAADELRIALVDRFGIWAALVIFTERRMTAEDLQFVSGLVPAATASLRSGAAMRMRAPVVGPIDPDDHDGPSVLILGPDDQLVAADATARRRLSSIPEPRCVAIPGLISFVSAQARWGAGGRSETARMRFDDGRWFLVDASLLGEAGDGHVAVVMRPAPATVVLDGTLRALGLSDRERQVAALVLAGRSAKAIAADLSISPWTAQDHLKAIYEKTGVGGRAGLVTLLPH